MELVVAGGGPAGSAAAFSACRAGHKVAVFEEHDESGRPQHCSGLVSREGLEALLPIASYKKFVINSINEAVFDFAGELFHIKRKPGTALVIDRAGFDNALASSAQSEGARFIYKQRWKPVRCDSLIGADGVPSAVALHYNFPKISRYAFTLKANAKIKSDNPRAVKLFYDNALFPGFFGWLIPHDEYEAEIGFGTTSQKALARGWAALQKKTGTQAQKPKGKLIPISRRQHIAKKCGEISVLLAGDAAGQVKSSSGGGLVFGTLGGALAGSFADSPKEYEREFSMLNHADMAAHDFLRMFFSAQPAPLMRLMSKSSKMLGLESLFGSYGNMDRPTEFLRSLLGGKNAQRSNSFISLPHKIASVRPDDP